MWINTYFISGGIKSTLICLCNEFGIPFLLSVECDKLILSVLTISMCLQKERQMSS